MNRRGHVFLGVATRQTALGSYLGADRHGWGYLVSQDLYHGGSRLRSGYGSRMSAGMTVELTLNTDVGLLSVGNADTGEDFGPAMNNLYEDMGGGGGGGGISLASGGGGLHRDARIDGRGLGGAANMSALSAAAAAALAIGGGVGSGVGGGGGGGGVGSGGVLAGDAAGQGTLWPAFAMHQPGDSVTFLPRRPDDEFAVPRGLSSSGTATMAASLGGGGGGGIGAGYGNLQAFLGGGGSSGGNGSGGSFGGGMLSGLLGGGTAGAGVGGAFATQALPLGYPDPIILSHACVVLDMAARVLREAGTGMRLRSEGKGDGLVDR